VPKPIEPRKRPERPATAAPESDQPEPPDAKRGAKTTGMFLVLDAIFDPRVPLGPEERLLWIYLRRVLAETGDDRQKTGLGRNRWGQPTTMF